MATEDRRAFKRFEVLLKITYYLYNAPYPKEGLLVDVSRRGACIKLQKEPNLSVGATILLEILTKDLKTLNMKGEIIWFKQLEDGFIAGLKFHKLLDDAAFRSIT